LPKDQAISHKFVAKNLNEEAIDLDEVKK